MATNDFIAKCENYRFDRGPKPTLSDLTEAFHDGTLERVYVIARTKDGEIREFDFDSSKVKSATPRATKSKQKERSVVTQVVTGGTTKANASVTTQ